MGFHWGFCILSPDCKIKQFIKPTLKVTVFEVKTQMIADIISQKFWISISEPPVVRKIDSLKQEAKA